MGSEISNESVIPNEIFRKYELTFEQVNSYWIVKTRTIHVTSPTKKTARQQIITKYNFYCSYKSNYFYSINIY